MALTTKQFKELLQFIQSLSTEEITEEIHELNFKRITDLQFYFDIFIKVSDSYWYIADNSEKYNTVTVKPTILSDKDEIDFWNSRNCSFKVPSTITRKWLRSIIKLSDDIIDKYPRLTPKLIADQLYKYANIMDLIPLKGINIYSNKDWNKICKKYNVENAKGFANYENGEVYVNIDTTDCNLWSLLCHEIRHIGLECNPIYFSSNEEKRSEENIIEYGNLCGTSFEWDDNWIDE